MLSGRTGLRRADIVTTLAVIRLSTDYIKYTPTAVVYFVDAMFALIVNTFQIRIMREKVTQALTHYTNP